MAFSSHTGPPEFLLCCHTAVVCPRKYMAYYSFTDSEGMKRLVGLVSWPIAEFTQKLPLNWSPVNHRSGIGSFFICVICARSVAASAQQSLPGSYDSLIQLHWLPIRWRVQYKLVRLMYGIVVGTCPEHLQTIVEPSMLSHPGLRSAACSAPKFVVIPCLRTKFSESAFSFSSPVAWNSLPADIRCMTNRQTFKTLTEILFLPSSFWYFIVTGNCLLLGARVLLVMGALQIYIDDDDDDRLGIVNRPNTYIITSELSHLQGVYAVVINASHVLDIICCYIYICIIEVPNFDIHVPSILTFTLIVTLHVFFKLKQFCLTWTVILYHKTVLF